MANEQSEKRLRVGVFADPDAADRALEGLRAENVDREHISVFCSDDACRAHFGRDDSKGPAGDRSPSYARRGGVLGSIVAGLAAIGGVVTAGGSIVFAAGALLPAMLGGGVVGSFAGAMSTRGVEKEAADFYDQAVEEGKILVAVEEPEADAARLETIERVFRDSGAEPVPLHEG